MTRILGLTGGIGTGKSTVAAMFAELGAQLIDADAIVHRLQRPGTPLLRQIAARFGSDVLREDGSLDRAALGARVFRDPEERQALNALVHPLVREEMRRQLEAATASGAAQVLLDIPLLFEGRREGGASAFGMEGVILVYAPRDQQIERQIARDGAARDEAERRVAAQMPIEEKRALANYVIDNSGTLEETRRQVKALYDELCAAR